MGLTEYKKKRNLKSSHEPAGVKQKPAKKLRFCIQKHAARRLHYDFRLECQGVLISWAVPKGPSLNPADKRLAIHVEDHPLEYQYFEGTIPKGNYGAGKVEIWDSGTYTVPHMSTVKEQEKALVEGLKKGHFIVSLYGKKLTGEFIFQKLKSDPEDKNWLIIKKEDSSSSEADIIDPPKHSSKKTKLPKFISPMLAISVDQPFDNDDWLFEVKWDGFRALAFINKGEVQLKSRTDQSWNRLFPAIVEDLKKLKQQLVLDGELVILDQNGKSDFQLMQNYQKDKSGDLVYYIFDVLYKDGDDLRELPLIKRKEILKDILDRHAMSYTRYSDHVLKKGIALFKEASKLHLEGIIGKKTSSPYASKRSANWVKIKTTLRQEVVIGGFTAPRGSRDKFGALLVGVYDDQQELIYTGHVGGGFSEDLLRQVYESLKPLTQKKSPFKNEPKTNAPATWIKPKLVCEVSFTEWTKDNRMRHPIFQGLRKDKKPQTVKKEIAQQPPIEKKTSSKKHAALEKETTKLTNLNKIYWPEHKYTKGDLLEYYKGISSYILPYLKDRPVMLHRFPDGIKGEEFYQKNVKFPHPDWLTIYPVKHDDSTINYIGINDVQSLMYAVNLGSIDLHPFMSRFQKLENPDYCVIDFDPHDISFDKVIEAILVAHDILDKIKIKHFCKTSGSKGLHLLIPLHAQYSFEQSRQFAEIISHQVHELLPYTTSLERTPSKRPKKIYLDCLQNRFGQTLVAPYSVRPNHDALVSTPLLWSEVNKYLDKEAFNIKTIPARLKEKGDLLKPLLKEKVNLKAALSRLQKQ